MLLNNNKYFSSFLFACVMFGVLANARPASSEQRVALVIGNSAYSNAPLRNPINDARAVAKSLNQLGFDVILKTNLNQTGMVEAVREFSAKLKEGDVALFYYSGHGMQVRGRNFLIPIGSDIRAEDEVPYQSFDVSQVLDKLEYSRTRANIVILDACRNNPFIRTFRSARVGLAQMDAPGGTLIAYSTAPGSEARDGDTELGTYTRHLVAHITEPGVPVEVTFRRVREGVTSETKDRQVPWESSSLKGDFYFNPAVEKPSPAALAPAPAAVQQVDPMTVELALWDSIKGSNNPADFQAYLDKYPNGTFSGVARNRIKGAEQQVKIAATEPKPAVTPQVATRNAPAPQAAQNVASATPTLPQTTSSSKQPQQVISERTWNYKSYMAKNENRGIPGYVTLEDNGNGAIFRMAAGDQSACYLGDLNATVTTTAATTIITIVPRLIGCEEERYVIKNDGTGGQKEIKIGSSWKWDGLDRGLTPRK